MGNCDSGSAQIFVKGPASVLQYISSNAYVTTETLTPYRVMRFPYIYFCFLLIGGKRFAWHIGLSNNNDLFIKNVFLKAIIRV